MPRCSIFLPTSYIIYTLIYIEREEERVYVSQIIKDHRGCGPIIEDIHPSILVLISKGDDEYY